MAGRRNVLLSVLVRTAVSVALIASAILVAVLLVRTRPVPARSTVATSLPRVKVMAARAVEVRREWQGFGTVQAMDYANVPARVSTTVLTIPAEIVAGAEVEADQLIVQLDDREFVRAEEIARHAIADLVAQLARIEIEFASWKERTELAGQLVALARAEFDRVSLARERGVAQPREVDVAKQGLLRAIRDEIVAREEYDKLLPRKHSLEARRLGQEAQLRLARQNVERCRIGSPLAGVLQAVDVEVGESLETGQRVARVVNVSRIEVALRLPALARADVRRGDPARLWVRTDRDRAWTSTVARIAPEDDDRTRTVSVYVEIEQNPGDAGGLAPGQFVQGRVVSGRSEQRWVVPRRALDGDRIFVTAHDRIASRSVTVEFQLETTFSQLGLPDVQWAVLRDPLREGELVVVDPGRSLLNGLAVKPIVAGSGATASQTPGGAAGGGESVPGSAR